MLLLRHVGVVMIALFSVVYGCGLLSAHAATLATPAALSATCNTTTHLASFSWAPSSGATSYQISVHDTAYAPWPVHPPWTNCYTNPGEVLCGSQTTTSRTVSGLYGTYEWEVSACSGGVCGTPVHGSNVSCTPPPVAPTPVSYRCAADGKSVTLSWPTPTNTSGPFSYYARVQGPDIASATCANNGTNWLYGSNLSPSYCFNNNVGSSTSVTFSGITPGVSYKTWTEASNSTGIGYTADAAKTTFFCAVPQGVIPTGLTTTNETSKWGNRTTLLTNGDNIYHGDVLYEPGTSFPYKMWFFGWAGADCNGGKYPGCDAIFYAVSIDGNKWAIYAGKNASGTPVFDVNMNPSTWVPVVTAGTSTFDQLHAGDPSVVNVKGTYYMVYSATDVTGAHADIMGAVSTDGIVWQKSVQPVLVYGNEFSTPAPVNFGNYARPSLLYENGIFKLWFDYWTTQWGVSTGYAELAASSPSATSFIKSSFTPVRAGSNPEITDWTNPDVVHVGNTYYSFSGVYFGGVGGTLVDGFTVTGTPTIDPTGAAWQAQTIAEATSSDGIHWRIAGYLTSDSDCGSVNVPRAYVVGNTMNLVYACQRGGYSSYDFRFKEIRRISRPL